nr:DUF1549 domain-containing protein [Betaproteobacteria bacterium]
MCCVRTGFVCLAVWLVGGARLALAGATIDYARDVLPILSANCYKCHGPDESSRQKDLRLDTKDGAFRVEDGVTVIVPGNADKSELVRRITSKDPEEVMPPADDEVRKLTAEQIGTLKRWVEQGAKWGTHWAFAGPAAPKGENRSIDSLVLERLSREKLDPTPPADKAKSMRRVTFDLTGLPPTVSEADAFIADQSPDAYEKLVDRLLASPRYGERWARHWLDVVRFAESDGFETNQPRPNAWRYRDYVIRALNDDMPFD